MVITFHVIHAFLTFFLQNAEMILIQIFLSKYFFILCHTKLFCPSQKYLPFSSVSSPRVEFGLNESIPEGKKMIFLPE